MERRASRSDVYKLSYDAENHLTAVSGDATASFGYDGDGQRITSTEGGVTTAYIGSYFEWNESAGTWITCISSVKHGLVERPVDWPWSSLHRFEKMGYYEKSWEWTFPRRYWIWNVGSRGVVRPDAPYALTIAKL